MKKLFYRFISVLFITINVVYVVADEDCRYLPNVLPKSEIISGRQAYYAGKIYEYQNRKPLQSNLQVVNLCSVTNYHEGCAGYISLIYNVPSRKSYANIFAYNTITNNIIFYQKLIKSVHPVKGIFKEQLIKAFYINGSNRGDVVPVYPDIEAEPFAIIAVHEQKKYYIFMNCNLETAWVMYHVDVIVNKELYDMEIELKISQLGYFAYQDLRDISLEIPIHLLPMPISQFNLPFQIHCINIPALPSIMMRQTKYLYNSQWYIVRILPNDLSSVASTSKASTSSSENIRHFCSLFDYTETCQGIKVYISRNLPWAVTVTLTYDLAMNTMFAFGYFSIQTDEFYQTFKGKVYSMNISQENQRVASLIHPMPDYIKIKHSREYVNIAADDTMTEYIFTMTCDGQNAWLMIAKHALHKQPAIEVEVQNKIEQLGFTYWNRMKSVPPILPEDNFKSIFNLFYIHDTLKSAVMSGNKQILNGIQKYEWPLNT